MKRTASQFIRKVPRAVRRRVRRQAVRLMDRVHATHGPGGENGVLRRFLPDLGDSVPLEDRPSLAGVTDAYLEGRFDLLGSGWLRWHYGVPPAGREGHRYPPGPEVKADPQGNWIRPFVSPKNLPEARKLWQLVERPYRPIDWQLDARSGARWSARDHASATPIGKRPGADVKAPWELARLQHLPRLALAFGLARRGEPGFRLPNEYVRGFRNQVCDFLALNPPRFGANWATAMLAGIRLTNLMVARDLFLAAGAEFDRPFEAALLRSTREHIRFILANLDWWDQDQRNNHYLANLAGLAFGAAYLPESESARTILAFVRREIGGELRYQFGRDGSHFEGATAYHAFSAEMVAWTLALLAATGAPSEIEKPGILPREARKRAETLGPVPIARACSEMALPAHFLASLTRPDGLLAQIGDNDSGRLLRLDARARRTSLEQIRRRFLNLRELPADDAPFWDEHPLDYDSTMDLLRTTSGGTPTGVSGAVAQAYLAGLKGRAPAAVPEASRVVKGRVDEVERELRSRPGMKSTTQVFAAGDGGQGLHGDLTCRHFPDSGLVVFSSPRLWLAVRCGGVVRADGGHMHEDALAFELHLDGTPLRVDPGTYAYTSLPWRRNQFRSGSAHGLPRLRHEVVPADETAVFSSRTMRRGTLLALDESGLVGRRTSETGSVFRLIRILPQGVEVTDLSTDGQPVHVEPLPWWSPGYGRLTAFEAGGRPDRPRTKEDRPGRTRVPQDGPREEGRATA